MPHTRSLGGAGAGRAQIEAQALHHQTSGYYLVSQRRNFWVTGQTDDHIAHKAKWVLHLRMHSGALRSLSPACNLHAVASLEQAALHGPRCWADRPEPRPDARQALTARLAMQAEEHLRPWLAYISMCQSRMVTMQASAMARGPQLEIDILQRIRSPPAPEHGVAGVWLEV